MLKDIIHGLLPGSPAKAIATLGVALVALLSSIDPSWLQPLQLHTLPLEKLGKLLLLLAAIVGTLLSLLISVILEYHAAAERHKKQLHEFHVLYEFDKAKREMDKVITDLRQMQGKQDP